MTKKEEEIKSKLGILFYDDDNERASIERDIFISNLDIEKINTLKEKIRNRYRSVILRIHPDKIHSKNKVSETNVSFSEVNTSYESLNDYLENKKKEINRKKDKKILSNNFSTSLFDQGR